MQDRYQIGLLALGSKCPSVDFFLGLHEKRNQGFEPNERSSTGTTTMTSDPDTFYDINTIQSSIPDDNLASNIQEEVAKFITGMTSITENMSKTKTILNSFQKWNSVIANAKSQSQCDNSMFNHRPKRTGYIKVQPTSISRRKHGVSRGSKRVSTGRTPNLVSKTIQKKRKRNLALNIQSNRANAKSHYVVVSTWFVVHNLIQRFITVNFDVNK